ncbi:hypothetical protein EB75_19575 [Mycobacterium sp. ST-F2]|uniref:SseB family protein n=1 Tax=Mycobacterium sp. ST-F2 TaxID=1490484 RepID=UPI00093D7AE1|nr:SseB family protein [Mycobacterium sp. ST-F2]OKH85573.1 hypothetical protein EB75_19575 [Mycobacterium sp. ST-F2]
MDFVQERAAFCAGFGDGAALIAGLRAAPLILPLDVDGQIPTWIWNGVPWLAAFTSARRCEAFALAAGRNTSAIEVRTVRGAALVDEILDKAPTPTGLVVDAASHDVMVFPSTRELTPHCYIDLDTSEVVKT